MQQGLLWYDMQVHSGSAVTWVRYTKLKLMEHRAGAQLCCFGFRPSLLWVQTFNQHLKASTASTTSTCAGLQQMHAHLGDLADGLHPLSVVVHCEAVVTSNQRQQRLHLIHGQPSTQAIPASNHSINMNPAGAGRVGQHTSVQRSNPLLRVNAHTVSAILHATILNMPEQWC